MGGSGARLGVRIGDEEPVEEGIYCGGGGGQKTEMFENKRMYLGGLKPIRGERGRGWVLWTESPPPQCSNRERNFRENPDAILAVSPPPPPPAPQLQPCPQGFRKKQSPLDIPCLLQSPRSLSWCRLRSCQSGEGEWGQPGKGLSAGGVLRDQPVRKEHCSHPNKTWLGPVITKVMPRTKRNRAPVIARMSTG